MEMVTPMPSSWSNTRWPVTKSLMTVLSVIPGIGAALVWAPAAIILAVGGHWVKALILAVFCAVVVGSVDNLLRPRLVGKDTQMHELMAAADVVMTKPGGLTTSEALACGTAIVVVNPIPGQESRNSDFLLENNAAIKVNNVSTLS